MKPVTKYPMLAAGLLLTLIKVGAGGTAFAADRPAGRPLIPVFATGAEVTAFCDKGLQTANDTIAKFAALPLDRAKEISTLHQWDLLDMTMGDVAGPIAITSATSPEKAVRDAAEACELKLSAIQTQLFQNLDIYERFRSIDAKDAIDTQVKAITLESFEDAGVALSSAQRARSKEIFDRLDALGIEFSRNTREKLATVAMTPAELEGLPKSYIDSHKPNDKGVIELKLNYPDYNPFMDNAVSSEARRRYYVTFNQIGGQRNLDILNEATQLRKELAGIFGKPSYAHYIIARRMAGTAETALKFLAEVKQKVEEVEKRDLDILRKEKADMLGRTPDEVKIELWDTSFYAERVRRAKYAVDQNALRRYFPTEASIEWMFDLTQRLYGVRFVKTDAPTWHPDVRYYDIIDDKNQRIAGAYLDPFPREGKYNHAAVWSVRSASARIGRTPISVLVTNLDRNGLTQSELRTLLHEFGHLLHGTLSRTRYNALAGTSTRRDFVEAPSQMFEEWALSKEPLALIKNHCKDCPTVDDKMIARLRQAQQFAQGIHYGRQRLMSSYDMAMAGPSPGDSLQTYIQLAEATPLGFAPGTIFPARFGHMFGYAAGYYGYMWSKVIALDMASAWNGKLLDSKVSRRYLDKVLSRGGEVPATVMVRDFLGRETSPEPFFAEITGSKPGIKK